MIQASSLRHAYARSAVALGALDVTLHPGITGLVGVNGAGKSTLLNILSGALTPTSGKVSVDGIDLYSRRTTPRNDALARIALMPQAGTFPRSLSCVEFVSYLTWMRGVPRDEARQRAIDALRQVKLDKRRDCRLGTLSGGVVRRAWLAQAIAAPGNHLLLDEPSTGLDPRQRATMIDLLHDTTKSTVLLSSHILEDITELAQRVIVLDHGKIVYDGPTDPLMGSGWFESITTPTEE